MLPDGNIPKKLKHAFPKRCKTGAPAKSSTLREVIAWQHIGGNIKDA
jgi:hypothetical protein